MGSASNRLLIVLLFTFLSATVAGQQLLERRITIDVNRQRLDDVLEILSNVGNFYFSYSSHIVKKDSLVSVTVQSKSVQEVLVMLFGRSYEFRESGNYIIIRKAPIRLTMVTNKAVVEERVYSVSGYVYDEQSGYAIAAASVYEKKLLSSALTDQRGFFKLRLKSNKGSTAELTVSKEAYRDESITIEPRHSQELTITMLPIENESEQVVISPEDYLVPDSIQVKPVVDTVGPVTTDSSAVERTKVGKWLLSAKQKAQSLNLRNFFTTRPYQVSLVPGLGSHGKLSGQVVNNFSLNALGGYSAGTNGVEIGGLFNINKKEVKYVQIGGLFNVVGGQVQGVQIAGLNNTVLDSVRAFQIAGVNNVVRGSFRGFQVSGVYNHITESVSGFQVAGVANFARRKVSGVQVAGVINFSNRETNGVQIAGVFNYSKKLKGVQFGLINIADTSEGYSIGLINIILKGYHKLSFSTNEVLDLNAAFKTGNSKFYSILMAGMNTGSTDKAYSFGYGLGSEIPVNKRHTLSINPELSAQYFYLGTWDYLNLLNKLHLNFNVKLGKYVSLFAGPSYGVYISDQPSGVSGYRYPLLPGSYKSHNFSNRVTGWFGWNAGISFF